MATDVFVNLSELHANSKDILRPGNYAEDTVVMFYFFLIKIKQTLLPLH